MLTLRGRSWFAGIAVAVCLGPGPTEAQVPGSPAPSAERSGDWEALAGNVALSGLVAGVSQTLRGGSFWRGFAGGAGGGAITFAGKKIATGDAWGSGLLGRQVAAFGTSLTHGFAESGDPFYRLAFPVGPLRLYWETTEYSKPHVRLDIEELAWVAYAGLSERFQFDPDRSLSAGAFVFTTRDSIFSGRGREKGRGLSGTILLVEPYASETAAHELVHVIQIDFLKSVAGLPLEREILGDTPIRRSRPWRWLDLGIAHYPFQLSALALMEAEAEALVR